MASTPIYRAEGPTYDTTPPYLIGYTPDQFFADPLEKIVAYFDDEVQEDSIDFQLYDATHAKALVPTTMSYDHELHAATLTPIQPLRNHRRYEAILNTAKDLSGNELQGRVFWFFYEL